MGIIHLSEHFERCAAQCLTLPELVPPLCDAGRELGFDFCALTLCDNLRQSTPRFAHFGSYPAVFAEVFVAEHRYLIDPILLLAQRRIGGFGWDQVGNYVPLRTDQFELLGQAAREGLCDGYTVPANVPGEPCGAVSFAARHPLCLTRERQACADAIARIAFEASRQLRGLPFFSEPVPHLSKREIEVMRRLAAGEIDKQIARALDISPETIRQYVKSARASYRARTRAQLIARALRDAQILFDDASIPPSGGTD